MRLDISEDRFESLRYVVAVTGLTRSTIYRHIEAGFFPRPTKLGRLSRWSRREVQDWMKHRLNERVAA